jgi:hypothetical protein
MENIFKYYQFSAFFKDESDVFSGNQIAYTELNKTHYLIFEKKEDSYTLFVSRYGGRHEIGKLKPEILETVLENYDKSIPEHRVALRRYLG